MSASELLIEPAPGILSAARRFADRIRPAAGDALVSVYVIGSALTAGYQPRRSDLNLLVVLRRLDTEMLEALARVAHPAPRSPRISPLFLTEAEVRGSVDALPIQFLDMVERHLLLEGENVLASVQVPRTYLRLQCEQELRMRLDLLKRTFLEQYRSARALHEAMAAASRGLPTLFRALLQLRGEEVPAHTGEALERVSDLYRVQPEGLLRAYAMRYSARRPALGETRKHYLEFLRSLEELLGALDQMRVK
jgi:hypothetical protein